MKLYIASNRFIIIAQNEWLNYHLEKPVLNKFYVLLPLPFFRNIVFSYGNILFNSCCYYVLKMGLSLTIMLTYAECF